MSGPMNGPEGELRNVLQSILMGVCTRCDFVHGEALRPSGNACLVQVLVNFFSRFDGCKMFWMPTRDGRPVPNGNMQLFYPNVLLKLLMYSPKYSKFVRQSGASYCSSPGAADFHRASLNFYFPPNVSIAGRVWKSGCTEVSILLNPCNRVV